MSDNKRAYSRVAPRVSTSRHNAWILGAADVNFTFISDVISCIGTVAVVVWPVVGVGVLGF